MFVGRYIPGQRSRRVEHSVNVADDPGDKPLDKAGINGRGSGGAVHGLHRLSDNDGLNGNSGVGLHLAEDDDKHLDEGGLGGSLVDGALAAKVQIVASADDLEEGVAMNAQVGGGDGGKERL